LCLAIVFIANSADDQAMARIGDATLGAALAEGE
jgi:hypothetical protein